MRLSHEYVRNLNYLMEGTLELSVDVDVQHGEAAVWLDNGLVRVGCAPALGGRTLSLSAGGRELLYRNEALVGPDLHRAVADDELAPLDGTMVTWRNFGGDKTWPAPQGWDGRGPVARAAGRGARFRPLHARDLGRRDVGLRSRW